VFDFMVMAARRPQSYVWKEHTAYIVAIKLESCSRLLLTELMRRNKHAALAGHLAKLPLPKAA
jgi:hypothetical protein